MKKAIYVRSALENELSVETQIEYCKLKLKPNDEYVVFSDNGYSSYDKEKPAFNEMMSAIERGEIDTVIIYRFNRVCRDLGSFTLFFKNLRYHNVEFISASEGLDSSNPLGEAVFNCLMLFSEIERENHSERCRRGWERRKQRMEGC